MLALLALLATPGADAGAGHKQRMAEKHPAAASKFKPYTGKKYTINAATYCSPFTMRYLTLLPREEALVFHHGQGYIARPPSGCKPNTWSATPSPTSDPSARRRGATRRWERRRSASPMT